MAKEATRTSTHPLALVGVLAISAVFAVAFGAGGYWFGLKPLVLTLQSALEVRGWQPVPAQVLDAWLQKHSDSEGTTWQVHARYRYEFAGKVYEGTRVGLDPTAGADNLGDWHERWHARLQAAQTRGESISVLVDPRRPSTSLIDPSLRWQLLAFRLPFAFIFTGVGVVAAGWFVRALWNLLRPSPSTAAGDMGHEEAGGDLSLPADRGQSPAARSAGAIWLFSIFWCCLAFPMAGILWTADRTPWIPKVIVGFFVVVGVGLMAHALSLTRKAWRYAGTALTVLPARPRAGSLVETTLLLPERAAAHQQGQDLHMRLAQYRVDEASSGSPERRVEWFTKLARVQPLPDGGLRLVARFELPNDAPAHGAQRSGERVDWRLELLHGLDGDVQLTYDIPVQTAPRVFGGEAALPQADRFDRRAVWSQVTPIEPLAEVQTGPEGTLALPHNVSLHETPQAWQYIFAQTSWRWAAFVVFAGLVLEALLQGRLTTQGLQLPRGIFSASAWWALAAFTLHAATCRWTLWVTDGGVTVQRASALWSRREAQPGQVTESLVHKLLYSAGSGDSEQRYYAVYARVPSSASLVRLSPGLAGDAAATALGQSIAQGWAHRRDRFSPGALRPQRTAYAWRPAWGVLLLLGAMAWSIWARSGANTAAVDTSGPTEHPVSYSTVDGRLLDAQNAGDTAALRAALLAGANPDLLAPNGSSVLMLAAHRGQLEHIEALLAAGAQPDLRQTRKESERGDTALLRAFYGGHLAVAQRLVQAGASLAARNRWDWGPVHMAAQSGCVPCLQWLAEQGQPLDEPAPASRGETPAMLAAAKGRIQALEWLEVRGVDLWRKDPHGKNALDWARFGKQQEAEHWLVQRQR